MSALPAPAPERCCEHCGTPLVRKRYASGRLERLVVFVARRFCDNQCAAFVTTMNLGPGRAPRNPVPREAPVDSRPAAVTAFPGPYMAFDSQAFGRVYQAALAEGVDLLELNDACWGD